jgi:hypothetical protein
LRRCRCNWPMGSARPKDKEGTQAAPRTVAVTVEGSSARQRRQTRDGGQAKRGTRIHGNEAPTFSQCRTQLIAAALPKCSRGDGQEGPRAQRCPSDQYPAPQLCDVRNCTFLNSPAASLVSLYDLSLPVAVSPCPQPVANREKPLVCGGQRANLQDTVWADWDAGALGFRTGMVVPALARHGNGLRLVRSKRKVSGPHSHATDCLGPGARRGREH